VVFVHNDSGWPAAFWPSALFPVVGRDPLLLWYSRVNDCPVDAAMLVKVCWWFRSGPLALPAMRSVIFYTCCIFPKNAINNWVALFSQSMQFMYKIYFHKKYELQSIFHTCCIFSRNINHAYFLYEFQFSKKCTTSINSDTSCSYLKKVQILTGFFTWVALLFRKVQLEPGFDVNLPFPNKCATTFFTPSNPYYLS
jgi:hypothetical protein